MNTIAGSDANTKPLNRLQHSHSPYLQQHADNPVDWYPWGDEAFEKARQEDKPVFLSIGYSTCHWCHVMEHESFEDPEVASLMNDTFINIKVDREERPDIDAIYMNVCQMITGSGGWPLTIIMTADKQPFFAGTYFPKYSMYGRIGMVDLTLKIKELWTTNRDDLLKSAQEIIKHINEASARETGVMPGSYLLDEGYHRLRNRFDEQYGGFGSAPKFPTPHNLRFLLTYWKRSDSQLALHMVEKTLQEMRNGGIYDHLGFGFHRYSTDSKWLVPHFEKMLYDQALVAMAYIEAYQATGNPEYETVVREIFTYVLRDMTHSDGGFYSAEDADSEGEEGVFYLFTKQEIESLLSADDARLALKLFSVSEEGNYAVEATGRKNGSNILHYSQPLSETAKEFGIGEDKLDERIADIRKILFDAREKRIHPHKDDKILTDWNGLMIAALAKAAKAFSDDDYAQAATRAISFVSENLYDENGHLLHRFRNGHAGITGNLNDYAFFMWGLYELYGYTFDITLIERMKQLQKILDQEFWDEQSGGYFFTADTAEELIVRTKDVYDGAVPSGNSVAFANLLRLSSLTGDPSYEQRAVMLAKVFQPDIAQMPVAYTEFLIGVDYLLNTRYEVIVVGDSGHQQTRKTLDAIRTAFIPALTLVHRPTDGDQSEKIISLAPFLKSYTALNDAPTFYICENRSCNPPVTEHDLVLQQLGIKDKK